MIDGVEIKNLTTHPDERGYFRELIRSSDPFFNGGFGQWSHSLVYAGVTKAWHHHVIQTDWWYVATGLLRVGLFDQRKDSPTHRQVMDFCMGDHFPGQVLKVPPGVAHGCKALAGPVHLFYVTSHEYNAADELRRPYNDPDIPFDWLRGPPIR